MFDYVLMGQYPSVEDMAAVRKGTAAAPIGTPRSVADMRAALAEAVAAAQRDMATKK